MNKHHKKILPKQIRYMAMLQVYEPVLDEKGKPTTYNYQYHTNGCTYKRTLMAKVEGKFTPRCSTGAVVALYDSPGKAARYCGKDGYVAEIDPADCRKVNCTPEEEFAHCEARMLYWGREADRLSKLKYD